MKEFLNQIAVYFFLKKRDPNKPQSINYKLMNGMNRISLLLFLVAVIVMLLRLFTH